MDPSKHMKTSTNYFSLLVQSNLDVSHNSLRVVGKDTQNQKLQNRLISENLNFSKTYIGGSFNSDILCIKFGSIRDSQLFVGDFSGFLRQVHVNSGKKAITYSLGFGIWSVCFITSSLLLAAGNGKFALINYQKRQKIHNLFIDRLGIKMQKLVNKMGFAGLQGKRSKHKLVLKSSGNGVFVVDVKKIGHLINGMNGSNGQMGRNGITCAVIGKRGVDYLTG